MNQLNRKDPVFDHVIVDMVQDGVALPSYYIEEPENSLFHLKPHYDCAIEVLLKTTRMEALAIIAHVYAPVFDYYDASFAYQALLHVNPHMVVPQELVPAVRRRLQVMLDSLTLPFEEEDQTKEPTKR